MTKPVHHLRNSGEAGPFGQGRAIDHDDPQAQYAGGGQFGVGPAAAGVFGDDDVNVVILQQREVVGVVERAAGDDGGGLGQQGFARRVDEPQKVVVLRRCGKHVQVLAADGKEDLRRDAGQGFDCILNALHGVPDVALLRLPRGAFKGGKGHGQSLTGGGGMVAHLRGKGMGGVNHMGDFVVCKIGRQAGDTAKAANPLGQGLLYGINGASGIGKDGVDLGRRQGLGQQARLGCAAQQKDAVHG